MITSSSECAIKIRKCDQSEYKTKSAVTRTVDICFNKMCNKSAMDIGFGTIRRDPGPKLRLMESCIEMQ